MTDILPIFKMISGRGIVGYRRGEPLRPYLFLFLWRQFGRCGLNLSLISLSKAGCISCSFMLCIPITVTTWLSHIIYYTGVKTERWNFWLFFHILIFGSIFVSSLTCVIFPGIYCLVSISSNRPLCRADAILTAVWCRSHVEFWKYVDWREIVRWTQ